MAMTSKKSTITTILLVRHGQDEDNAEYRINGRRDCPLTDLGRTQAKATGESLRGNHIDCIYSSPLKRAFETATIISQILGISQVNVDGDLIERDYGILTGRPPSEIRTVAKEIRESNNFRYILESEGIEPYPELWRRAGAALSRIQARHEGQTVLIVAHNEIMKMIRSNFEGTPWEHELSLAPITNCQVIVLGDVADPGTIVKQPGDVDRERTSQQ
jgi:probable phosphoglycerate mutase